MVLTPRPAACDYYTMLPKTFPGQPAAPADQPIAPPPSNLFVLSDEVLGALSHEEVGATFDAMREMGLDRLPFPAVTIQCGESSTVFDEHLRPGYLDEVNGRFAARKRKTHPCLLGGVSDDGSTVLSYSCVIGQRAIQVSSENQVRWLALAGGLYYNDLITALTVIDKESSGDNFLQHYHQYPNGDPRGVIIYAQLARIFLLVVLATRNVVKKTSINKRAARGQGRAQHRGPDGTIYLSTTRLELPEHMETEGGGNVRPHLRRGHVHTVVIGKGRTGRKKQWFAPTFVNADPDFIPKPRKYVVVAD